MVLFFSSAPTQTNQSTNLFQKKETPINEMQRFILENKHFLLFFVNIKIKIRRLAKNAAFISQYIHFTDWSSTLTACNLFLLFFSKVLQQSYMERQCSICPKFVTWWFGTFLFQLSRKLENIYFLSFLMFPNRRNWQNIENVRWNC